MHDLTPVTALGGATPQVDTIGMLTIAERDDLALASVAARLGREAACTKELEKIKADASGPLRLFWTGPEQWMVMAPLPEHEDLAEQMKARFADNASVTEQSGAWVAFDVRGDRLMAMFELLCPVPVKRIADGEAQRTMIHQMGCFVIRQSQENGLRVLGPRASAQSLHHALTTAAHSVA